MTTPGIAGKQIQMHKMIAQDWLRIINAQALDVATILPQMMPVNYMFVAIKN